MVAISAAYRGHGRTWRPVEIIGDHPASGGLIVREVGKFYRGVLLARREQVRLAGPEFDAATRDGRDAA